MLSFLFAWTNKVSPFEQLFTLRGHQKKKAVMMMLHIQGATPKNDELARIELPNFTVADISIQRELFDV